MCTAACHLPTAKKLRQRWMLNDGSLLVCYGIGIHTHGVVANIEELSLTINDFSIQAGN
jgi:hypothetical protein